MKHAKPIKQQNLSFHKRQLCALILLALPALHAQAQNVAEWTGTVDNDLQKAENWQNLQHLPSGSDTDILINNGSDLQWSLEQNPNTIINQSGIDYWNISSVTIGQDSSLNITRDLNDPAGTYSVQLSEVHIGLNGGKGELTVNQAVSAANPYSDGAVLGISTVLSIGSGIGSGNTASEGTVNVMGSGKSIENQRYTNSTLSTRDLNVGVNGGKGTLNVDGAALDTFMDGRLALGAGTGSSGSVNVLGGGKFANGAYDISSTDPMRMAMIGDDQGHGTLHISGASATGDISRAHFGAGLTVGNNQGFGDILVDEGALLYTQTRVPSGGTEFTPIQLGVNSGTGKALIDGQGSAWHVGGIDTQGQADDQTTDPSFIGELHVGVSGTGEVALANGGTLSIGKMGYMVINDPDSIIPDYKMTVTSGGTGTLYLADQAGGNGTLSIGGAQGQAVQGTGVLDVKDIQFGDGIGSVIFNHTDESGNYVFDTPLVSGSGQSHIKQVAGVTTFNTDQLQFTGLTTVTGGTLVANAQLGGTASIEGTGTLRVENNGLLVGAASIGGAGTLLVNNLGRVDGTVSVNDAGTLLVNDLGRVDGAVSVNDGGTLLVNDLGRVDGAVSVNGSAGTLAGTGSVGATTVNAGGIVSPGASKGSALGTLTVDSITFNPGSVYQAQVNPDGTSDIIVATTAHGGSGKADINGGIVQLEAGQGNWAENTKYVILDAQGGVTGTFDAVQSNLAFLNAALEHDAQDVYLYLTRNQTSFVDVGETYNERGTASGITSLGSGNTVYDSIVSMSADGARNAYNNLSGEIHGSVHSAMLTNSRYARAAVNQRLDAGVQTRQIEPHKALWVSTWAHDGHLKNDGNATRLDNKGYGILVGGDVYDTGTTTVGLAAGYENSDLKASGTRVSSADVDAIHLMAYGRTTVGAVDLRGGVGYSRLSIDTTRNITVPGLEGKNKASYNGGMVQIFAEGSHTFDVTEKASVTPYAGLAYQQVKTNGFTESTGATALHGNSNSNAMTTSTLGVRGNLRVGEQSQLYADFGWQHNFGSNTPDVDVNFIGANRFNVKGVEVNRNSAIIGLGAHIQLKPNMNLSVGYEGQFGNQSRDHAVKLLWELKF